MSTRYTVEFAKSGRSSCKRCKEKIEKGALRVGSHAMKDDDYEITTWAHPHCFVVPRKFNSLCSESSSPGEYFVTNVLEDGSEDASILPAQTESLTKALDESSGKKKKASDDTNSPLAGIKRAFEALTEKENGDDSNDKKKKSKKSKTNDSKSLEAAARLYGKYHKLTIDQLKDYLRWNRQVMTGTKPILLYKVIDGEHHGQLSRCSMCGGRLKLNNDNIAQVVCSGSFDEDTRMRIDCAFTAAVSEAPRTQPWYTQEPTEEEQEAMDKLAEQAAGGGDGGGDNASDDNKNAIDELTKATSHIEWNLEGKAGIKKLVRELAAALGPLGILDLAAAKDDDDDDAKTRQVHQRQLGAVLQRSHRSNNIKSTSDFIPILIQEFGLKAAKKAKAERKQEAVGKMVKVEANANLVSCFQELGELYFKAGNRNAGASYTKVVNALKDLDFEITSENAPGLYKGKTKVPGIGKGSGEKIVEYLRDGTIAKLEEKRADAA